MYGSSEKEQVVQSLVSEFGKSEAAFLVNYKGLSVAQLSTLRKKLRQLGGAFCVAKVTLVKRAIDNNSSLVGILPMVHEQVALVFTKKDSPAVAKVLCDFASANASMSLVGGYFESNVLDQDGLRAIGALPSREILLSQLCGVLKAPIAKLAYTIQAIIDKQNEKPVEQAEVAS